jgi:cbb3-type cytochrome oxidase subunit 3
MLLIFLEALGALLLLVLIVWWTMFSGRRKGELDNEREEQTTQPANERDQP